MSQYNFNFEYLEQASLDDIKGFPGNLLVGTDNWFSEQYATSSTTSADEEQKPAFVELTDANFTLLMSQSASPTSSLPMMPSLDPQLLDTVASSSLRPARAHHRYSPYPASNPAHPRYTSLSPPLPQVQNSAFFAAGQAQPGPLDGAFPFPGQLSLPLQHCEAPPAAYPPVEYWPASSTAGTPQQWDARTDYVLGWADSLPSCYAQQTAGPECIPDGFWYIPDASATGFFIPPSGPYNATPGPSYFPQLPGYGPAQNASPIDPGPSRRRRNHSQGVRLIPGGMPPPAAYSVSSLPMPPNPTMPQMVPSSDPPLIHTHAQHPTALPSSDSPPPAPRRAPTRSRKRRAPAEDEDEKPRAKRRKSGPSRAEHSSATSQVGCAPAGVQQPSIVTFDTEEPEDDLHSPAAPNHVNHGAAGPSEASTSFTPERTSDGRYLCFISGCQRTCTTLDDVKRHVGTVQAHASFRELAGWDAFMLRYGIKERHLNDHCEYCGSIKRTDTSFRHEESKKHLRNMARALEGKSSGESLLTNGAPKASSSKAPVGVDRKKRRRKSGNTTGGAPRSTRGRRTHQL